MSVIAKIFFSPSEEGDAGSPRAYAGSAADVLDGDTHYFCRKIVGNEVGNRDFQGPVAFFQSMIEKSGAQRIGERFRETVCLF